MKIRKAFIFIFAVLLFAIANSRTVSAQGGNNQPDMTLDAATRTQVIEGVIKRFNQSYVFPEVAKTMEQSVREQMRKGEYDKITSAQMLAETLTANLRQVSKDTHVGVVFSSKPLPPMNEIKKEESAAERENRRLDLARINNGFLKVERLKGNVGFLDIDLFVDPAFAGDTSTAAMNFLANTDALIIDLRYCPGGSGEMVKHLLSYFFADSVFLGVYYQRENDVTNHSWTSPYVPGQRYLKKDVYILTSSRTHSAAEAFAYNLQSLKRATVIGETTRGGAHPSGRYRITEHFGVQVPIGHSINAVTKTDWEGKGVLPDIQTTADKAFKVAHLTVLKRILEKNPNQSSANDIKLLIEKLENETNVK
jgi:C-terminal processing protease CtpA/Prc